MTSLVNEGNVVLIVLGDDVPSSDTADFIATIKQRIGDSGKLQIANLSDVKKGAYTFRLIWRDSYCIRYKYILYNDLFICNDEK